MIEPAVYDDLNALGVEVTPVGRATTRPYRNSVKIKLPITAITASAVEHGGGMRFSSSGASLVIRDITMPTSGLVTGKVRGSELGQISRTSLFFQAPSKSPLGDVSLRLTFTLARYFDQTFGIDLAELDLFGFAEQPQHSARSDDAVSDVLVVVTATTPAPDRLCEVGSGVVVVAGPTRTTPDRLAS